jgi:chemotaxis signal transduction protein
MIAGLYIKRTMWITVIWLYGLRRIPGVRDFRDLNVYYALIVAGYSGPNCGFTVSAFGRVRECKPLAIEF